MTREVRETAGKPPSHINWRAVALPGIGADTVAGITGGSGAIGARLAEALVQMGARVAIMGRSRKRVDEVVHSLMGPGETMGLVGDVAEEPDCLRVVNEVLTYWGHIDCLVQSPAVSGGGVVLDSISAAEIDAVMRTNVRGAFLTAKAAAEPMRARRRGRIVNVASVAAYRVMPRHPVYGVSKAALHWLSDDN